MNKELIDKLKCDFEETEKDFLRSLLDEVELARLTHGLSKCELKLNLIHYAWLSIMIQKVLCDEKTSNDFKVECIRAMLKKNSPANII